MYINPIEDKIYKTLNQDRRVNKYFNSKSVGKCMKLIDNYYRLSNEFTMDGWETFYLTIDREIRIGEIAFKIKELTGYDDKTIVDYIYHRIIGQTYNGFVREMKFIKQLNNFYPNLDFRKALYELDEKYFTDFEVYTKDTLVFGGQIKPISYKYMSKPYQVKAKENHEKQRLDYRERFKVPHLLIYYQDEEIYELQKIKNKIDIILHYNNAQKNTQFKTP